jgi:hypothetical protein
MPGPRETVLGRPVGLVLLDDLGVVDPVVDTGVSAASLLGHPLSPQIRLKIASTMWTTSASSICFQ